MTESPHQSPAQVKSENDAFLLVKSLKELKDLRSQLHYAADYCESSFLKSTQKDQVLENTKEYLCRAVITVVDHLGSASANLEKIISQDKTIPEAELRIDCISQKLLAWKQFSQQSALADLCMNPCFPRFRSRYLLAELPNHGNSIGKTHDMKVTNYAEAKTSDDVKGQMNSSIHGFKVQNCGFEFQKTRKPRRTKLIRVSFHRSSVLFSLVQGTKRISRVNS